MHIEARCDSLHTLDSAGTVRMSGLLQERSPNMCWYCRMLLDPAKRTRVQEDKSAKHEVNVWDMWRL
jgi:hypothetical protein